MNPGRRFLAIVTAYALAFNALLSGLAIAGPAVADAAPVICGPGGAAPAPNAPARPHACCPAGAVCAMPGCGVTAVGGQVPSTTMPAWVAAGQAPPPPDVRPRALVSDMGRRARGPPSA